jgi:hypothetical protein
MRRLEPSKKEYFFVGRGVFFLTRPLMGDPFTQWVCYKVDAKRFEKFFVKRVLNV